MKECKIPFKGFTKLKKFGADKHTSLFRKEVNYPVENPSCNKLARLPTPTPV
jgi:hypothetical protein